MNYRITHTREESSWRNMITRCENPNSTGYEYYGGRGIKVCERWRNSFMDFYSDMGPRPEDTTLDRIDVNGNYELSNCRWATWEEQGNNRTNNIILTYKDESHTISEWANIIGLKCNTLQYRLIRGWTVPEALGKEQHKRIAKDGTKRANNLYNGKLTDEEVEEIKVLRLAGETIVEIGKTYDIDSSNISRIMKKFEIKPIKSKKQIFHEEIYDYYLKVKLGSIVSRDKGIAQSTVSYIVDKFRKKQ